MKKYYIDGPCGQVHLRHYGGGSAAHSPLICLPPAPYGSIAYDTLAPLLAAERDVVAVDYPGYGASDGPQEVPTIGHYASSVQAVAGEFFPDRAVALLGFHSGCLVAVELAASRPDLVEQLILVDIPYFDTATRAVMLEKNAAPTPLSWDMEMLAGPWEFSIAKKRGLIPLARAYELFVDQISTGERMNHAFRAAFSYPCEERFRAVTSKVTVICSQSGLKEPTQAAAGSLPDAQFVELETVRTSVLDRHAGEVAAAIRRCY